MTIFDDGTQKQSTDYANGTGPDNVTGVAYKFPFIGGYAGGDAISRLYKVSQYPTTVLISPNKTIVEDDIFPLFDGVNNLLIGVLQKYPISMSTAITIPSLNNNSRKLFYVKNDVLFLDLETQALGSLGYYSINGKLLELTELGLLNSEISAITLNTISRYPKPLIINFKADGESVFKTMIMR